MSAKSGWYPDPGGAPGLFRYWDGKAWSAATSPDPRAAAPSFGLVSGGQPTSPYRSGQPASPYGSGQQASPYGSGQQTTPYGSGQGWPGYGPRTGTDPGTGTGQPTSYGTNPGVGPTAAYASYQQAQKKKSPVGWWIGGGVLLIVLVIIGVLAVKAVTSNGGLTGGPGGQTADNVCPKPKAPEERDHPADGRVHGGPMSYPELGSPWKTPEAETRLPFGIDTRVQTVDVEPNYKQNSSWVASVIVAELQAGDGFFTPEQGAKIVVRCILGTFYDDTPVTSDVTVDKATKIDGHDAWLVESQLSFDIPNLRTKGELLIVAIVSTGATAGLYYASIPDTRPDLVPAARQALAQLTVDG